MTTYVPDKAEFLERAKRGNLVPVYREILADMETPVSAFRKIADSQFGFLLESVEGGESLGRYSFLGANPHLVFRSKKQHVELLHNSGKRESFSAEQPLDVLRGLMAKYSLVESEDLPPFCGGAVGYMSYDAVRQFEPVGERKPDVLGIPEFYFMFTDTLMVFDHVRHRIKIVSIGHVEDFASADECYEDAVKKINVLHHRLLRAPGASEPTKTVESLQTTSNFTKEEYCDTVRRCQEYIAAGDIFQVVPSQRFSTPIQAPPFDVYRALRAVNPSPYMFYLKLDGLDIAGSSPEILVKLTGRDVQVRPIAGTRKRGATRSEDQALAEELLADPKERAEHIMLVDLGRNDCGRVCDYGSVRVDDLMVIERYSHVMHIVSNVTGQLRDGCDAFDVLRAAFPAGTVSGAPKIRAMQIIDEMEPSCRGLYAGAVGYFSFSGNLDTCIAIRTVLMIDGVAHVQAGGGVVADSDPELEYQETVNKASAVMRALELAESGL